MNATAKQRIKKAQRRILTLKRNVRWWSDASAAQKLSVVAEARGNWRDDTYAAACECNLYESALDYLSANEFYRRRAV